MADHSTNSHHRRSIRLQGYDYAQIGAYFVTVCTQNRECLFGDVVDDEMQLSDAGHIVVAEWLKTAEIRQKIELDRWAVMPNHFHGIVVIINDSEFENGRGTARRSPTMEQFGQPVEGSIPTSVRSFKSAATKRINEMRGTPGAALWQRNDYEHILRDKTALARIREYIINNSL